MGGMNQRQGKSLWPTHGILVWTNRRWGEMQKSWLHPPRHLPMSANLDRAKYNTFPPVVSLIQIIPVSRPWDGQGRSRRYGLVRTAEVIQMNVTPLILMIVFHLRLK